MRVEDLHSLVFNPAWTSKLLACFLSGARGVPNHIGIDYDLLFLVLPFVFDSSVRNVLCEKRSSSTLKGLLASDVVRAFLLRLDERVVDYRAVTKLGLIASSGIILVQDGKVSVAEVVDYKKYAGDMRPYLKAAFNLGGIFSKSSCSEVFLRLGVYS